MRDDRDPLNLHSLPDAAPPADVWPDIQARLALSSRTASNRPANWIAAAAMLAVALGLTLWITGQSTVDPASPELAQWVNYSMDLEEQLRNVEDTRTRYRGHEALAVAQLQLMLAAVDAELESTPQENQLRLWKQRAVVLNDLLAVQGTQGWIAAESPRPVVTRSTPSTLVAYEI